MHLITYLLSNIFQRKPKFIPIFFRITESNLREAKIQIWSQKWSSGEPKFILKYFLKEIEKENKKLTSNKQNTKIIQKTNKDRNIINDTKLDSGVMITYYKLKHTLKLYAKKFNSFFFTVGHQVPSVHDGFALNKAMARPLTATVKYNIYFCRL